MDPKLRTMLQKKAEQRAVEAQKAADSAKEAAHEMEKQVVKKQLKDEHCGMEIIFDATKSGNVSFFVIFSYVLMGFFVDPVAIGPVLCRE